MNFHSQHLAGFDRRTETSMKHRTSHTSRRTLIASALAASCLAWTPVLLAQPAFPSKPITLVVPFPPGGATDTQFRALAQAAARELKQPVIVTNQPGAAGTLAPATVARSAAPDGYTLVVIASSVYRVPHLQQVTYDVNKDFTYVAGISEFLIGVVVAADSPLKSAQDLVTAAKAAPGRIAVGAISNGSSGHVALMRWAKLAGFEPNFIPYKGASEVMQAVLGGQVNALSESSWASMVQQGKLRALAIYANERNKQFPNVPTLKELGWNVVTQSVVGIAGPKGIDAKVVQTLQQAFQNATRDPVFLQTLAVSGQSVNFMDHDAYTRFIAEQFAAEKRSIDELKAAGVPLTQ
jgi:tripartite-type tricarboxylate transporter receptor subunit TctC